MKLNQVNINKNNFDFIRFMLAFIVMLHHITALVPGDLYAEIAPYFKSQTAIRGFFIISGFLVAKSLQNTPSTKKYFIKRIRRIVPAYTFVIIFFAIILGWISTLSISDYFSSSKFWEYLGANLIYQNYLAPCLPGVFEVKNVHCSVNGALWTIKIEEGFYLILPVIVYFHKKYVPNRWLYYGIIYMASLLFFNYFNLNGNYTIAKQLPGAMAYFACGIVAFYNFDRLKPLLSKLVLPAIVLYVLEYIYLPIILFRPLMLSIAILYFAYHFKFLNKFGKYGDFTYGTYIFHYPIIQLAVWFSLQSYVGKWGAMLLIVLVTLLCAVFSWKVIETRFISRNYIKRIDSLEK